MSNLPKDPVILLSFTNTQLRDNYANLEEFCKAYIVDENDIKKMNKILDLLDEDDDVQAVYHNWDEQEAVEVLG